MATQIAITGFEGAGLYYGSAELARHLEATYPGQVTAELVEDSPRCVDARASEIIETGYARVLLLGTDSLRRMDGMIAIESVAYNAYDFGLVMNTKIVTDRTKTLGATLPSRPVQTALIREGIQSTLSAEPGRYLCNRLFFMSLWRAQQSNRGQEVGFWHLPPTEARTTRVDAWRAGEIALGALLQPASESSMTAV